MLVSPDRLGWTYGGSLATHSQSWCQLLRNIHTHTHTPSYPSPLPAVWLSQKPAPHEHRGNFGSSSISHHPSRAKGRRPGRRTNWDGSPCSQMPTHGEGGGGREGGRAADKGEGSEHKALFNEQSSMDPFPASHVSLLCLCRQLAQKSFPKVTGWLLCETET